MKRTRLAVLACALSCLLGQHLMADTGFSPPQFAGKPDPFPGQTGWYPSGNYAPSTLRDQAEGARLCAIGAPSECVAAVMALYRNPTAQDVGAASSCYADAAKCPFAVADALFANRERNRGFDRWGLTYTSCPNVNRGYCGEREQVVNPEFLRNACLAGALPFQSPGPHDCNPTKTEVLDALFTYSINDQTVCKWAPSAGCAGGVTPPPPPVCGDGKRDPGETCENCPRDVGACATPRCGDGNPDPGETCVTCPEDVGICAPPPIADCIGVAPVPPDIAATTEALPSWFVLPGRRSKAKAVRDWERKVLVYSPSDWSTGTSVLKVYCAKP